MLLRSYVAPERELAPATLHPAGHMIPALLLTDVVDSTRISEGLGDERKARSARAGEAVTEV